MAPAGVEGKDSYMTWKQAECSLLRSCVQIESQAARRACVFIVITMTITITIPITILYYSKSVDSSTGCVCV